MTERHPHWRVCVETSGEQIVAIEPEMLAGREISEADENAIRTAAHHLLAFIGDPSPAPISGVPQDISTAPANTDVLVWWPIVKLDDDGDPTEEVVGGCWLISEDQGGYWIEPEVMNATGDHMGDDHTYADKPSQWMPLPARLFIPAWEVSTDE